MTVAGFDSLFLYQTRWAIYGGIAAAAGVTLLWRATATGRMITGVVVRQLSCEA